MGLMVRGGRGQGTLCVRRGLPKQRTKTSWINGKVSNDK